MSISFDGRRRPEAVLDVYNLLLGALLFFSPWLFAFAHGAASADAWLGGAVIAAVSLAALMIYADWEEWIALLAGLWMMLSPFVLGFAHTIAMYVTIGIGFVVAAPLRQVVGTHRARAPFLAATVGRHWRTGCRR
jgi:site-specific recombinase